MSTTDCECELNTKHTSSEFRSNHLNNFCSYGTISNASKTNFCYEISIRLICQIKLNYNLINLLSVYLTTNISFIIYYYFYCELTIFISYIFYTSVQLNLSNKNDMIWSDMLVNKRRL